MYSSPIVDACNCIRYLRKLHIGNASYELEEHRPSFLMKMLSGLSDGPTRKHQRISD